MSFAAYLTNIEAQTGVSPDEFIRLATEKGLTRAPRPPRSPIG